MFAILHALGTLLVDLFKSRSRLEAGNLFLRQQLHIALRRAPPRLRLRGSDRALTWMTRLWPSLLGMAQVVASENSIRRVAAGPVAQSTVSKYMVPRRRPLVAPATAWAGGCKAGRFQPRQGKVAWLSLLKVLAPLKRS